MFASFLGDLNIDVTGILIRVFVLCLSLSFHEFAHAWVANRLGDDTAAQQGRLTLNPLVHLDPIGTLMFMLAGIGWAKPVPVNPARFSRSVTIKSGMMKVSLAGPMSNLVMATAASFLYYAIYTIALLTGSGTGVVLDFLLRLMQFLYVANIVLAVFNLLPVPPLDGFKIFGSMLPNSVYYRILQYERYIGMAFLFLVIFGRGVLGSILSVIQIPFNYLINEPIRYVFSLLW